MNDKGELIPSRDRISNVRSDTPSEPGTASVCTRDHDVIRRWADERHAEPATGEASLSGPATINVNDGGAGIRFNFPGASLFRPITWDEWFANFDRYDMSFVFDGDPQQAPPSSRYRIVRTRELDGLVR